MNKSKKINKIGKKIYQELMNKTKLFRKKLNKTVNKPILKKCQDFCKIDYMVEMKKVFKKSSEKFNIPYKSPTKQEDEFAYNTTPSITFFFQNQNAVDHATSSFEATERE